MALLTAEAALSSQITAEIITGFQYQFVGVINDDGVIKPESLGAWSLLSGTSWQQWTNFTLNPQTIKITSPLIDLGRVDYFTIDITAELEGTVEYLVYVSSTGAFAGEESETYIEDGDTNIPAFYGQFMYVIARANSQEFRRMTVTTDKTLKYITLNDINSSTLSGTNTARQIPMPETVSAITDIKISVKATTPYAVNLYVSDTATSEIAIPVIKSKNATTPTFALYGIDNDPRNAIVDIEITALPRQAMIGGNIRVV
jgi:hypothetical protein